MHIFKSNWILGTLVAFSLGATSVSVGMAGDFGHMWGGKGTFKELNLTNEQKEKLKNLRKESKDDRKEDFQKMRAESEAFRKKMASNAADDELRKDFAEQQKKRSEFAKQRFEHMLKVRAILTPEQRQKFAEITEKKMKKHKGKWGKSKNHDDDEEE